MKSSARHLLLLSTIAMLQTSCSLPPAQAWKIVNTQGLIPYIAMETGRRPFPPGVTPIRRQSTSVTKPMGLGAPAASTPNRYLASPGSSSPTAGVPRALPTAPPAAVPSPAPKLRLTTTAPKPRLSAAPKPPVKKAVEAAPKPAATTPTKPAAPKAAVSPAPKPTASPAPKPKVNSAPTPAPKPATAPKPSTPDSAPTPKADIPKPATSPAPQASDSASGIPYGSPIPGRPGLVNSPYAGKHQIVDVSGLQAGQEIKCPYSGRLFLVPPGQVSANKATAPGAPKP